MVVVMPTAIPRRSLVRILIVRCHHLGGGEDLLEHLDGLVGRSGGREGRDVSKLGGDSGAQRQALQVLDVAGISILAGAGRRRLGLVAGIDICVAVGIGIGAGLHVQSAPTRVGVDVWTKKDSAGGGGCAGFAVLVIPCIGRLGAATAATTTTTAGGRGGRASAAVVAGGVHRGSHGGQREEEMKEEMRGPRSRPSANLALRRSFHQAAAKLIFSVRCMQSKSHAGERERAPLSGPCHNTIDDIRRCCILLVGGICEGGARRRTCCRRWVGGGTCC